MTNLQHALTLYGDLDDRRSWSMSKRYNVERLIRHLGARGLEELHRGALIEWALAYPGSLKTADRMLATLSGALRFLHDCMILEIPHPEAPAATVRVLRKTGKVINRPRTPPRLSDAEIREIIAEMPVGFAHWIWFLVDLPVRGGELCRLHWQDVDLMSSTVLLRDRKTPHGQAGNHQRIALIGRSFGILASVRQSSGPVCPISRGDLSAAWITAARAAGVNVTLHDLRHEGISRLFDRQWTIPQVSAVSGHRTWPNLKRYTAISTSAILELDEKTRPPAPAEFNSSRPRRPN